MRAEQAAGDADANLNTLIPLAMPNYAGVEAVAQVLGTMIDQKQDLTASNNGAYAASKGGLESLAPASARF